MAGLFALYPWSNFIWSASVSACSKIKNKKLLISMPCSKSNILTNIKSNNKIGQKYLPQLPAAAKQII